MATNINNSAEATTLEMFEKVLEAYKKDNPVKYATKEAAGEFERQRAALGGKPAVKKLK